MYLVIVSHPTAASIFFNLHIIRVGWISSSNNSPVDQGHLTLIDHNHNRVPGVPGMVPTSIQTPHIKRVPSIFHYHHQAVFGGLRSTYTTLQSYNSLRVQDKLTFRLWTAALHIYSSSATNTGDPLSTLVWRYPLSTGQTRGNVPRVAGLRPRHQGDACNWGRTHKHTNYTALRLPVRCKA